MDDDDDGPLLVVLRPWAAELAEPTSASILRWLAAPDASLGGPAMSAVERGRLVYHVQSAMSADGEGAAYDEAEDERAHTQAEDDRGWRTWAAELEEAIHAGALPPWDASPPAPPDAPEATLDFDDYDDTYAPEVIEGREHTRLYGDAAAVRVWARSIWVSYDAYEHDGCAAAKIVELVQDLTGWPACDGRQIWLTEPPRETPRIIPFTPPPAPARESSLYYEHWEYGEYLRAASDRRIRVHRAPPRPTVEERARQLAEDEALSALRAESPIDTSDLMVRDAPQRAPAWWHLGSLLRRLVSAGWLELDDDVTGLLEATIDVAPAALGRTLLEAPGVREVHASDAQLEALARAW